MKIRRAKRGVPRTPFHILLDKEDAKKLEKLAKARKVSRADVIRSLISEAA